MVPKFTVTECFSASPLRERRDDILPLAAYFAQNLGEKMKRKVTGISEKARACLRRYDWPGNVRELENAIEHAVVLGSSEHILPEDLPEAVIEACAAGLPSALAGSFHEAVIETKRRKVQEALERAKGVVTEAAKLLDMHPNYLHRLIKSLGIR